VGRGDEKKGERHGREEHALYHIKSQHITSYHLMSSPILVLNWKMSSSCRMLNTKEIKVAKRYT
jgi:hypothetical protein